MILAKQIIIFLCNIVTFNYSNILFYKIKIDIFSCIYEHLFMLVLRLLLLVLQN